MPHVINFQELLEQAGFKPFNYQTVEGDQCLAVLIKDEDSKSKMAARTLAGVFDQWSRDTETFRVAIDLVVSVMCETRIVARPGVVVLYWPSLFCLEKKLCPV